MEFKVWNLGCGIFDLEFGIWDLEFVYIMVLV
jgi:hypothetical protein